MQSALNLNNEETLMTADELRAVTMTPEQLFEQRRNSIVQSLMGSMVGVATQNGSKVYSANVDAQFDAKLLSEVAEKFKSLGYTVTTQARPATENFVAGIVLTISWE